MTTEAVISRLEDLIDDRKSFLSGADDDIYKLDIEALEKAVEIIKYYKPVKRGRWVMREKTKLFPTGQMAVLEGHILSRISADKPFTEQESKIVRLKEHRIVKIPYCSICGNYGDDEYDKTPYCPYCGARMDGENNG